MDHVTTALVSSSLLLDHDVPDVTDSLTQNLVEHGRQSTVITGNALSELDHTSLVSILRGDDSVHAATQLVMSSGKDKQPAAVATEATTIECLMESSHVAAVYSLPSIMSLSTFTASSVDNNNISINCSFTNSSVDSRDDDAYGLHVTFDDDNRPQLRPKDGSQISTGPELLKAARPTASAEVPNPASNNPVTSASLQVASDETSTPEVACSVACSVSSAKFSAVCPSRTLSSVTSADLSVDARMSVEMTEVAECGPSTIVANPLPHRETNGGNPVQNGGQIEGCLLYTSPSPRDRQKSRMPSSA